MCLPVSGKGHMAAYCYPLRAPGVLTDVFVNALPNTGNIADMNRTPTMPANAVRMRAHYPSPRGRIGPLDRCGP